MPCCGNLSIPYINNPSLEFPFDTTRTISPAVFRHACALPRHPLHLRTAAAPRCSTSGIAASINNMTPEERARLVPNGARTVLNKQYYDLASVADECGRHGGGAQDVPTSQLLYGSDVRSGRMPTLRARKLGLAATDAQAIERENALRLFPRFKA